MFPFLFWLLAAPNCSQWKKLSLWKRCWPASCRAMAAARPLPVGLAELLPSWPSGSGASRGASGGVARGETCREREKEREPSRAAQATVPPAPFELGSLLPAAPLAAPRAALCLFRRGHCHENGIFVSRGASPRSRRAGLQGHRWHGAGGSHLSLQRVALSSPAGGRAAFCSSARRASPSSRRAPPPLPPRPALPASPRSPSGHPALFPSLWGPPPLGKRRCGGWVLEEQPLQCSNEVAPPLPGHARKNYSRPGICSGRAELKSLSWAWQPSQRSRQLFQGQPWRVQSSRLTLQEAEEPCSAGTGPAPLSSCRAVGWWGRGGDTGGSAGLGDAATQHLTLLGLR